MTLADASLNIVATLGGAALATAVIAGLIILRRPRYQGPAREPYAGFRTGARTEAGGEFLQLECEGYCPGTTAHQVTGDEEATCVLCGTHRSSLPDFAADDQA